MSRVRAAAVAMVAVALLTSCSSKSASHPTQPSHAAKTVLVDETKAGRRISLKVGDRLVVTLHSTYWQLPTPRSGVLAVTTEPVAQPSPDCSRIPGTGCGTATATYTARSAGTTTLAAHRDSCGEALRCVGSDGDWSVDVDVTR